MAHARSVVIHLSLIPHIGPLTIKKLEERLAQRNVGLSWLYGADVADVEALGISSAQANHIVCGLRDQRILDEELSLIEKHKVQVLVRAESAYPRWLSAIYAPPAVLYVQGVCEVLGQERLAAVVGSRNATSYGRSAVDEFVPAAVAHGWGIVSGGARGIDSYAHRATLQHGGKTIAVLGSGLLKPYPPENRSLFTEIAAYGGAVISPFPLRMPASPGNFPARNRIIAGMCTACIVVQAAEKSGALITATFALSEGRDVGVVPGSIFDPLSAGCHRLLRDGATPLCSRDEFLTFLGVGTAQDVANSHNNKELLHHKEEESPLLVACQGTARHFEELLPYAGGSSDELYSRLWELQVEGKITQTVTGLWQRC